jgi:hypothetical protein
MMKKEKGDVKGEEVGAENGRKFIYWLFNDIVSSSRTSVY